MQGKERERDREREREGERERERDRDREERLDACAFIHTYIQYTLYLALTGTKT